MPIGASANILLALLSNAAKLTSFCPAGAAADKGQQQPASSPLLGFPPLPMGMEQMAPQAPSFAYIVFALQWGVALQSLSTSLIEDALQSLDGYLMSSLVFTGSECLSDGNIKVSSLCQA